MNTRFALALLVFPLAQGAFGEEDIASPPAQPASSETSVRCSQVRPVPPSSLLKKRTFKKATVVIEVEVVPPGEVSTVVVMETSGHREWEESVIDAMKKMTCSLGAPVTKKIVASQTFTLVAE